MYFACLSTILSHSLSLSLFTVGDRNMYKCSRALTPSIFYFLSWGRNVDVVTACALFQFPEKRNRQAARRKPYSPTSTRLTTPSVTLQASPPQFARSGQRHALCEKTSVPSSNNLKCSEILHGLPSHASHDESIQYLDKLAFHSLHT